MKTSFKIILALTLLFSQAWAISCGEDPDNDDGLADDLYDDDTGLDINLTLRAKPVMTVDSVNDEVTISGSFYNSGNISMYGATVDVELATAYGETIATYTMLVDGSESAMMEVGHSRDFEMTIATDPPPAFDRLFLRLMAKYTAEAWFEKPALVYAVSASGGLTELPPIE